MQEKAKGNCKHGTFILTDGCTQCIAEAQKKARQETAEIAGVPEPEAIIAESRESMPMDQEVPTSLELYLVKVRYYSKTTEELSSREYTYYSVDPLNVGDIVTVPVKDSIGTAKVSSIDVQDEEIASFRDKVKIIPTGSVTPAGEETLFSRTEFPQKEAEDTLTIDIDTPQDMGLPPDDFVEVSELTAVVKIAPEEDKAVIAIHEKSLRLEHYAKVLVLSSVDDVKRATNDLSIITGLKKAIEEKRREYTQPINEHLKAVNEAFKTLTEPLINANKLTKDKMLAYDAEVTRKRQEQEAINRKRQEAADMEAKLKGEVTEPVNLVEVTPLASKSVSTDMGTVSKTDCWKYEVIDFTLLPNEFKLPDTVMLNSIAKKYHNLKEIPGVRFFNDPIISMRNR